MNDSQYPSLVVRRAMPRTVEFPLRVNLLIIAEREVPVISDAEREILRGGLEKARLDIASNAFDVLTPQSLRIEFNAIYYDGKSDAEIDDARKWCPELELNQ